VEKKGNNNPSEDSYLKAYSQPESLINPDVFDVRVFCFYCIYIIKEK